MNVATKANVRTANAAKTSGMRQALKIAFSGGAVMGTCVAGLGAFGVFLSYRMSGLYGIDLATLTSLAFFVSYAEAAKMTAINLLDHHVIIGLFLGGMLTFCFQR